MKNYAFREGVDVTVAFSAGASVDSGPSSNGGSSPIADRVIADAIGHRFISGVSRATVSGAAAPHQRNVVRGWIKSALRTPAKILYRLLKPVIRPIAFRLRAYFLNAVRSEFEDMRQHMAYSRAEALELRKYMRQETAHLQQAAQAERLKFAIDLSDEFRTTVSSLQQDMLARLLPPLAVLQAATQQLGGHTEALVKAAEAPVQFPQLDRVEQLALEEAKARADSEPARALKLDRIEQYALSSARRFAINCGGEQVMVRTEVGFLLCSGTDQALLSILIESGELEPGTRRVIQRILKPGDVFIDVGANVGLHTLAAARAMEGKGKIIAFEPFAETASLLEASVWLNGFSSITEIHQAAVSTSTGMQSLYLGGTSGHHSLFPLHAETFRSSRTVEVPLMRIDDVVDEEQSVTLIKIDVEGAELEVLESARQTILRNPAIAIVAEFGPSHLKRIGRKSSEWIAAFTNFGLDYRAINEQSGALESWSIDQLDAVDSINLLFARAASPIFT